MMEKMWPVLWTLCAVWVAVGAIIVETPQDIIRAFRGESVTLPCTYHTSTTDRSGFIQWDKLLWSNSERVVTWNFMTKQYIYGGLYENRVNISANAEQSDASITISQLTMDDNGTYECTVSLLADLVGTLKSRARLLVLVLPSKPDCTIQGETVIGNDIQLTCQSKEGSPAPQYSWKSYNVLNQERPLAQPVSGQPLSLKNISTDTSGYYICVSSNEAGMASCNITVAVRMPSMNMALYAGIAGGVVGALIIIGIIIYCCCCRGSDDKAEDREDARPNRAAYQEPPEQLRELSSGREEEKDSYRHEDQRGHGDSYRNEDQRGHGDSYRNEDQRGHGDSYRREDQRGHGDSYRNEDQRGHGDSYRNEDQRGHGDSYRREDQRGHGDSYRREDQRGHGDSYRNEDQRGHGDSYRHEDQRGHGDSYRHEDQRGHGDSYRHEDQRGHGDSYRHEDQRGHGDSYRHEDQRGHGDSYRHEDQRGHGDSYRHEDQRGHGDSYRHEDQRGHGDSYRHEDQRGNGDSYRHEDQRGYGDSYRHEDQRGYGRESPAPPGR
ncbi:cell surface A33 antigen [Nycticebus coucang]|uniref:cell surface A33 antigen n=1 Tax=Nycticebus coucang TaxID=9470 RepID=UPI00234DAEA3|nr:cell surface A33 antigen [Nycticebus coucang]